MPARLPLFPLIAAAAPYLTLQRRWLATWAFAIPSPTASRWLLLADAACLIAVALRSSRRPIAVPLAIAGGFLAVNVAGMLLTDFYLALAVFHVAAGAVALVFARRFKWIGVATLGLALALGVLT